MALYNSTGKIALIERTASGVSQSGREWQKVTLVLEVNDYKDTYIKQAFIAFGDLADTILNDFVEGDEVEAAWSISSREWNGRWYTDATLFRITPVQSQISAVPPRQTKRSPIYDKIEAAQREQPSVNYPLSAVQESLEPQAGDLPF